MNEPHNETRPNPFGQVRTVPVQSSEPPVAEIEREAQNTDGLGASLSEPVTPISHSLDDIWLTVDEAVTRCEAQGLFRTAKTIRKWAERSFNVPEGEVVSSREDTMWGRYRWKIEQKSLDRKIAEELSREAALPIKPVQTGSDVSADLPSEITEKPQTNTSEPVQTSAIKATRDDLAKQSSNKHEPGADVRTGAHVLPVSSANSDELARLRAENEGLRSQQERDQDEIKFLREEVTFNRSLKTDFAQNSKQLLETLETLAVGGRLEKPTPPVAQPVRYRPDEVDSDRV
ncbi:hypothetical protein [uncultured Roseobacter sp.]|uniref:hypothetical protein n=1 Tax=uncultured Roseobacter sp. TaxID=114847 RepID=UPI002637E4B8|nr:hypothetical protein [uncultured Roseobacter sp.]